jgi:ribosome biogenesis GTPase
VQDATGEHPAVVAGRLRHSAESRADFPAVGDWVALRPAAGAGPRVIEAVLPRSSAFVRKVAGETTEPQVVAANVDLVFVVAGLDGDYNPRRIERYLAAAWDSGATPVVVLNKADLVENLDDRLIEVEGVAPGVPVVALSALSGAGFDALAPWLSPGHTVALLGSSGVGKSTIVNALLGERRLATAAVREDDSRGLVALPCGALLIDTPGMRELQLWADESSTAGAFPEIEALAAQCRFSDCRHESEPDCAVLAAQARGELPAERLESWRKLQRELRWLAGKQDVRIRIEEEARWRAIHLSMRDHPKLKRRGERP